MENKGKLIPNYRQKRAFLQSEETEFIKYVRGCRKADKIKKRNSKKDQTRIISRLNI